MFGSIITLLVLLYPAAFIGGLLLGKIGARAVPFRMLINVVVYIVLALIVLPLVTG
jgi:antibiotic biosynthesis monooxygenase (ABM) superfamily enzyme